MKKNYITQKFISMKRILLMASICLGLSLSSCLENVSQGGTQTVTDKKTDSNTKSFQSANGKFAIDFPGKPQGPESKIEQNKAGLMQTFTFSQSVSNSAYYFAYYKDYPVGVLTASNTEAMLKKEAETFMKNCGSKIDKSSDERLDGNKGLSFSGTLYDTVSINMRAFFVGKRYYQFGTIAANSEISEKDSKKFINSFEVIK